MAKSATINTRIDAKTKRQAMNILAALHIPLSDAIGMYLRQIVYHRGIPFDVRLPNEETLQAIKQLESGKGVSFDTVDELLEDLES